MRNLIISPMVANALVGPRFRLFAHGDEILLPSGCHLAKTADPLAYLLKGYAADGSDVSQEIRRAEALCRPQNGPGF